MSSDIILCEGQASTIPTKMTTLSFQKCLLGQLNSRLFQPFACCINLSNVAINVKSFRSVITLRLSPLKECDYAQV